jgi:hypothetical protein
VEAKRTTSSKEEYGDQDMMEETPIAWLDVLMQKSLQLIYVDPK